MGIWPEGRFREPGGINCHLINLKETSVHQLDPYGSFQFPRNLALMVLSDRHSRPPVLPYKSLDLCVCLSLLKTSPSTVVYLPSSHPLFACGHLRTWTSVVLHPCTCWGWKQIHVTAVHLYYPGTAFHWRYSFIRNTLISLASWCASTFGFSWNFLKAMVDQQCSVELA